jgi:lon-related putative ATP-dependent protease
VRAIEFGIDIHTSGYNIYVLGPTGSGRVTALRHFIDDRAKASPTPDDWCYVHNFEYAHKPQALKLPPGHGRILKAEMESLIEVLRAEIPRALESDAYRQSRSQIINALDDKRRDILDRVQKLAGEMSFAIQQTPQGTLGIIPIADGEPLSADAYDALPEDQRADLLEKRRSLEHEMEDALRDTREFQRAAEEELDSLRREITLQIIDSHMLDMNPRYEFSERALHYLEAVRQDILDSVDIFEAREESAPQQTLPGTQGPQSDPFRKYQVNVLVEHEPDSGAPVVFVDLPSYRNLIGRIEHEVRFGMMSTDFTHIRGGGLHQANGGFLIVRAQDLLRQPLVWEALKRALNISCVVIEDEMQGGMSVMSTQTLEPERIPLDLTVVMVGSQDLYYALYEIEEDFRDLFRVKADFGDQMDRNPKSEAYYAQFIATRCHEDNLPHFSREAVGCVVEHGSWMVSDQRKLSTQFGHISPLLHEAAFFARRNDHALVTADDVMQAIEERNFRNNELEELAQERITDGTVFIDLEGEVEGQVNALVVIMVGDHTFGLPSRVTARVQMGREGIIQIDRESDMTGPIHDKGVLTLEGYLGGRYAKDYPLTLTAHISFEQNYGGVEGDSASSTELYALLSALSGFSIRQDLAVTGSVNQRGQVQPIGGVTQKVEGFYNACKVRGLTGTQGCIIPQSNIEGLMLNDETIAAVENGEFHVYAVATIDDGIALLTGRSPEEIHEAVDKRLRELAEKMKAFEDGDKSEDSSEDEE